MAHLHPHRHDLRAWAMACLGIPLVGDVPWAEHRDWLRRALAELAGVSDPRVQRAGPDRPPPARLLHD